MSEEKNSQTDSSVESEVVRKLVTPDFTEVGNADNLRTPSKVDRTELATETSRVTTEPEVVRKLVTPDLIEAADRDDPRNPQKVDRTGLKMEGVANSGEG